MNILRGWTLSSKKYKKGLKKMLISNASLPTLPTQAQGVGCVCSANGC